MLKEVRMEGLEPPCLAALDPKSNASTNFATSAICGANINSFFLLSNSLLKNNFNSQNLPKASGHRA